MDRLTLKEGLCNMASTEFCFAQKDCYTCPHGRKCFKRLADYEDTELSPEEITAMKADNERMYQLIDIIEGAIKRL